MSFECAFIISFILGFLSAIVVLFVIPYIRKSKEQNDDSRSAQRSHFKYRNPKYRR